MNTVEWRAIPGFPSYEASSAGQIRRCVQVSPKHPVRGRCLKPRPLKRGHCYVNIRNEEGVIKSVYVHRLVALTFLGPPPTTKHQVAHWDGDATNNNLSNLRWATNKENCQDSVRLGRSGRPSGEKAGKAKLTNEQAAAIRRQTDIDVSEWARRLGVAYNTVSMIRRGLTYKDAR